MTPDGNVVAAVQRFRRAVDVLCEPCTGFVNGAVVVGPSLYSQLLESVVRRRVGPSNVSLGGVARSSPPAFTPAVDLRAEIDAAVRRWAPAGVTFPPGCSSSVERLRLLAAANWRPQDTDAVESAADAVESWCAAIRALLNQESVLTLSAACPACGENSVARERDGERVRRPALQVAVSTGATCLACDTVWGPELFVELARTLGCGMPTNVLE